MSARLLRRTGIGIGVCLAPALLGGCTTIRAYPERSGNLATELGALDEYHAATVLKTYADKPDDTAKKAYRDEVVTGRIRAIDLHFGTFQQAVFREGVSTNLGADLILLGLGGATATTGGAVAKAALGATSAGVAGAKASIDKNVYFEKTMPALLGQMLASRKTTLVKIQEGLDKNVNLYPLNQALIDLEDYYNAGTIPGAIVAIVEQAGASAKVADELLLKKRDKAFFSADRQQRATRILDRIANLPDAKAIELVKNLPARDSETALLLQRADPQGLRASNATNARRILLMLAPYAKKSDVDLDAWEAALTVAEKP
jgi:hypothetical protein